MKKLRFSDEARTKHASKCPPFAIAGGALMIISGLLSWSFDNRILGDISVRFYPLGIQLYAIRFSMLGDYVDIARFLSRLEGGAPAMVVERFELKLKDGKAFKARRVLRLQPE